MTFVLITKGQTAITIQSLHLSMLQYLLIWEVRVGLCWKQQWWWGSRGPLWPTVCFTIASSACCVVRHMEREYTSYNRNHSFPLHYVLQCVQNNRRGWKTIVSNILFCLYASFSLWNHVTAHVPCLLLFSAWQHHAFMETNRKCS